MKVDFTPGALFKFPAGEGKQAFSLMLAKFPYVSFYRGDAQLEDSGTPSGQPLFTVAVEKAAYSSGGWGEPIRQLPVEIIPDIPKFFWQSPVRKSECNIVEPGKRRISAGPSECVGLEAEAVWGAGHIKSRFIDAHAGRANIFSESLKVKL
ncbi:MULTISPECIES: hypothetical protein [unclassified Nocardiopsis]|uniref:hypothetical protein n=1 Tax=unclassified Nocardiopsis TaxID=2649073 RepID=UPI001356FCC2|nr:MULTISPECIES: hypothetical protein [unclassified Nocardiopsis]